MITITSTRSIPTFINCLVYGDSGIGKTVLGATAPKPIILSAEKGLLSLADQDIPVIEIHSLSELIEAYNYLIKDKEYQTVVLDSISEIGETLLTAFKVDEKDPRKAYGRMAEELLAITRKFRDLDKHVVFIAKQELNRDEFSGKITYRPSAPGQSYTGNMAYMFDEVFVMRMGRAQSGTDLQDSRFLQTQPNVQYVAKDRSGRLENSEIPNLSRIFNKIVGK